MDVFEKPLVYQVPGMESVKCLQDISYSPEKELKMDVYLPSESENLHPGIIFVHGGPISPEMSPMGWGIFRGYGALAAASGIVGVTFNHRFYRWADIEYAATDIITAIEYFRDNAPLFHVDPDRLCFWTFSGGGAFLSLVFKYTFISCIVAYYAVMDLHYSDTIPDNIAEKFSASSYVDTPYEGPPLFIARAGLDSPRLNQGIDIFVKKALASNADIEVMNHAGGCHGFDILDDNSRSREIIARSVDFVKSRLSKNK